MPSPLRKTLNPLRKVVHTGETADLLSCGHWKVKGRYYYVKRCCSLCRQQKEDFSEELDELARQRQLEAENLSKLSGFIPMANPERPVVHYGENGDKLTCGHWVPKRSGYYRQRRCPFCGQAKTEAVLARRLGRRA